MDIRTDVAIVGAGAAGLMTALQLAQAAPGVRVALLDGRPRPGAKILVSGGGRCNVTNLTVKASDFHGDRRGIARILGRFGAEATVAWFAKLGVGLVHEPEFGKLFPASNRARTVLEALLAACAERAIELVTDCRIESIERTADGFVAHASHRTVHAARLVLATGGCSLPKSGSDGVGYGFARRLGHSVVHPVPALVPLVLSPHPFAELHGISFPAELQIWDESRRLEVVRGPLLLTHFGISGPAALDVSRHWTVASAAGRPPGLRLSLYPGCEPAQIEAGWRSLAESDGRRRVASLLPPLPARLSKALLAMAEVGDRTLGALDRPARRRLLGVLTGLALPVTSSRGFREAEVTAGGVPLDEVNLKTLESKRCPGLYLVGEILDVDGRLGGFNFQWAWSTGHVAGQALGRRGRDASG